MTRYRRGDIVLVWFPNSDLRTFKRRPALVVQRDGLKSGLSQLVLAMVTTNMKRLGHASRVLIHRSPRNRLLADSVVMTDNLVTVIEKAIDRTWGHIDDTRLVDNALRHTLNL